MTLSTSTGDYRARTITAFFDSRSDADEAVARLRALGISEDAIRLVPGYERDTDTATDNLYDRPGEGFWDSLRDFFLPDDDRDTYAEGLRRGGVLVTVTAGDEWHDRALDILDDEGTIDIDERAESWRSEGWTGRGATSGSAVWDQRRFGYIACRRSVGRDHHPARHQFRPALRPQPRPVSTTRKSFQSSKRPCASANATSATVACGYAPTLSRPRSVSRSIFVRSAFTSIAALWIGLWTRPITLSRIAPSRPRNASKRLSCRKSRGVKEELVLRKDVQDRTETVSDRVRSTEVEIEDERLDSSKNSGKTGTVDGR